jgi:hypothetical protein
MSERGSSILQSRVLRKPMVLHDAESACLKPTLEYNSGAENLEQFREASSGSKTSAKRNMYMSDVPSNGRSNSHLLMGRPWFMA